MSFHDVPWLLMGFPSCWGSGASLGLDAWPPWPASAAATPAVAAATVTNFAAAAAAAGQKASARHGRLGALLGAGEG